MHLYCMRRSSVVQLTLLPMLATAAVATADVPTAAPSDPPTAAATTVPTSAPPPPPPEPVLAPPGMTPTLQELTCEEDPNWRLRPDCPDDDDIYWYDSGGVIRGGFGTYFYGSGGG
jgi:hypothetical protein